MSNTNSTPQDFYVYIHRKATTGEVFYCGKGAGNRAWAHGRCKRSAHWQNIVRKHGLTVEIVQDGLQEWAAHELECDLIALYGRRDLGYGGLVNLTDGGEGMANPSLETKMKLSKARAGVKKTKEHVEAIRRGLTGKKLGQQQRDAISKTLSGRRLTEDHKRAISAAHTGKVFSDAHKNALSIALTGKKRPAEHSAAISAALRAQRSRPILCIEARKVFQTLLDAQTWLRCNGQERAAHGHIWSSCNGNRKSAYGYTWRYADAA